MHSPENKTGDAPPRRIGEILISQGRITGEQLDEGLRLQQTGDRSLGQILVSLGYISEKELAHVLSTRLNVEYVEFSESDVDPDVLKIIPQKVLVQHNAVPLRVENGRLLMAMSDPNDLLARSDLTVSSGYPITTVISSRDALEEIQSRLFSTEKTPSDVVPPTEEPGVRVVEPVVEQIIEEPLVWRSMRISEKKIGEILRSQGKISSEQHLQALDLRRDDPRDLGKIMVSLGFVAAADVAQALAQRLKLEYVVISELSEDEVDGEVLGRFSDDTLRKYKVLPLRHEDDRLVVAMHDPNDIHVLEDLAIIAGCQIRPVVASEDDLEGAFAHLFGTATLDESEGPLPAPEQDADSAVSAVGDIKLKVMVAEDDPVSRMIAVKSVESFGCECVEAKDGLEAWKLYQEDASMDVVLSDWLMPGMDGLELCQRVRGLERQKHTYFVFLTALGDQQHLTDGMEVGADEYLIKPLDRELLRTKLEDAFRAKSLHEHLGASEGGQDNTPAEQGRALALRTDVQPAHGDKVWDLLISNGKINEDQLRHALEVQLERRDELGKVLVSLGYVSHTDLAQAQAARYRLDFIELTESDVDKSIIGLVEQKVLRKHNVMPLRVENNRLVVAISEPTNIFALEDLTMLSGYPITPVVALEEDITTVHNKLFAISEEVSEFLEEASKGSEDQIMDELDLGGESLPDEAPIIRLVSAILTQAVGDGASDIHIEPQAREVAVRMRVDGVLRAAMSIPAKLQSGVVARFKIVANLDIAEKRVPQDGRFSVKLGGKRVDLRVASLPTVYGEKIVLRLLDTSNATVELTKLGFARKMYERYEDVFRRPYGTVLVTGPTGSGKSTTLYATLNELNTPEKNIITVEDPVEFRMKGVNQIQTNPRAGLTFASALRSILRADPDVVMIGEIRDLDTAKIAIEAALTGHLVLATLHTNSAPAAVSRLTDMGIEPFLTSSAVDCVIAQRLARRLCENCKVPVEIEREILESMEFPFELLNDGDQLQFHKGVGCDRCGGSGYRGRVGLYELMVLDEEIRSLVLRRASTDEIAHLAERQGMIRLREDGLLKAAQGMTTVEEIFRTVV